MEISVANTFYMSACEKEEETYGRKPRKKKKL